MDAAEISALELDKRLYKSSLRRQKMRAMFLVLPLILFILVFFISPISFMLYRSFYNPTVANLIPQTLEILESWNEYDQLPSEKAFKTIAYEIQILSDDGLSGQLAEEVNRRKTQTGSVIKRTARKLLLIELSEVDNFKELMISQHERWGELPIWLGIKGAGDSVSMNYFANALDYKTKLDGSWEPQEPERRVYVSIYMKTFYIAFLITLLTLLLGYPLAYYLSIIPEKKSNLLLIFVLLPFWTSLLVRTTAWIAILQSNGVVNGVLSYLNIIDDPLDLIYNRRTTIISMTHILLPFMILPLYSVMKGIDPAYMRASKSLGANSFFSFIRVYLPLSMPGLSAGALLVFIIAIGYYITPALLGGVDGQLISNLVAYHMRSTNNWELAAALGSILLISIVALYWVYNKLVGTSIKL